MRKAFWRMLGMSTQRGGKYGHMKGKTFQASKPGEKHKPQVHEHGINPGKTNIRRPLKSRGDSLRPIRNTAGIRLRRVLGVRQQSTGFTCWQSELCTFWNRSV